MMIAEEKLIRKINSLPPGKIEEVINFIDSLAESGSSNRDAQRFALISAYAVENAGSELDLDEVLEDAGIEALLAIDEAPQ